MLTNNSYILVLSCSFHFFTIGCLGLRLVDLHVPGAVRSGEAVQLRCEYDLENAELYSVKWYKNNVEFYRYLPSDAPPGQSYELLGTYVQVGVQPYLLLLVGRLRLATANQNQTHTFFVEESCLDPAIGAADFPQPLLKFRSKRILWVGPRKLSF